MALAFAVWLTGPPASGKSAIASALSLELRTRAVEVAVLESDALRAIITPHPRYDDAERELFYAALRHLGRFLVERGVCVIFDATANRRAYRDAARAGIERFVEIFVDCPLEVCAARDPKGLYRAAREGRTQHLPGVQSSYEPPERPDLVLASDRLRPRDSALAVLALLERRGWLTAAGAGAKGN